MRRLLVPVLVALATALSPSVVAAQQQTWSTGITISAGVADGLTVLPVWDLLFGDIVVGTGKVSVLRSAPNIGKVQIVGQQNKQVTLTLTPPPGNVLTSGGNPIPYAWAAAYNESTDAPMGAATVVMGSTSAVIRLKDSSPSGKYGQAYLYIYGDVTVGNVLPGKYQGTFTVTAAY